MAWRHGNYMNVNYFSSTDTMRKACVIHMTQLVQPKADCIPTDLDLGAGVAQGLDATGDNPALGHEATPGLPAAPAVDPTPEAGRSPSPGVGAVAGARAGAKRERGVALTPSLHPGLRMFSHSRRMVDSHSRRMVDRSDGRQWSAGS